MDPVLQYSWGLCTQNTAENWHFYTAVCSSVLKQKDELYLDSLMLFLLFFHLNKFLVLWQQLPFKESKQCWQSLLGQCAQCDKERRKKWIVEHFIFQYSTCLSAVHDSLPFWTVIQSSIIVNLSKKKIFKGGVSTKLLSSIQWNRQWLASLRHYNVSFVELKGS